MDSFVNLIRTTNSKVQHTHIVEQSFTIRMLKPIGNSTVECVTPDDLISTALTKMRMYNYSILPVVQNPKNLTQLKGVLTADEVLAKMLLGFDINAKVSSVMNHHPHQAKETDSVFNRYGSILKFGYVLVMDHTNSRITGVITQYDLGYELRKMTEPFLLISEIEKILKRWVSFICPDLEELKNAKDGSDISREIKNSDDLTLGEICRMYERDEYWNRLCFNVDKSVFIETLRQIVDYRNDIMHFRSSDLSEEDVDSIKSFMELCKATDPTQRNAA